MQWCIQLVGVKGRISRSRGGSATYLCALEGVIVVKLVCWCEVIMIVVFSWG